MNFWKKKRVMVTGGYGFLGKHVLEELTKKGCEDIFIPRQKDYDLVQMNAVKNIYLISL